VGRGALAGPVVAAAVIVPVGCRAVGVWGAVRDSKLLRPSVRAELALAVQAAALAWAVGMASVAEIDEIGIAPATRRAMQRAIAGLAAPPDALLIDWVRLPALRVRQECWKKADQSSVSVAAASIVAKVARDRMLAQLAETYPDYGFANHKGYGTQAHLDALALLGPCIHHRRSFAPIAGQLALFEPS
jgi:ribonuclease HII